MTKLWVLVLLLSACPKPAPTPAAPAGGASYAAPAPTSAPASAPDACVAECVQRNQMKAVGAEVIERDCQAECAQK